MGLAPEAARAALDEQRVTDWKQRRTAAIDALPDRLAETREDLRQLLRTNWYTNQRRLAHMADRFEALGADDRARAFDTLLPGLGPHAEAMWQLGKTLPYQTGWLRHGFRSTDPGLTLDERLGRYIAMVDLLRDFEADAPWVARWAAHLGQFGMGASVGTFLAAVLDQGGPEGERVDAILRASVDGRDEVGGFGRHIPGAYLEASDPAGWAFVETMLLAAQRQEGFRQSILEEVDLAHPGAFRRILQVILDAGLLRFSATIRAVIVWLGVAWDEPEAGSATTRELSGVLREALRLLDEPGSRAEVRATGRGADLYLSLWADAIGDGPATVALAAPLLRDPDPERRYAAAHLLGELRITSALGPLAMALDDPDLRIAARALQAFAEQGRGPSGADDSHSGPDVFDAVERLLARLPASRTELEPIVWRTNRTVIERDVVASVLVAQRRGRPIGRLAAHLGRLGPDGRFQVATALAKEQVLGPDDRAVLMALAGDPSPSVREAVLARIGRLTVEPAEVEQLEALLDRKAEDLRRAIVALLLHRSPEEALASADRLTADRSPMRRLAGLEILRRLQETGAASDAVLHRAMAFRDGRAAARGGLTDREMTQLAGILGASAMTASSAPPSGHGPNGGASPADPPFDPRGATLADAFGLLRDEPRTTPTVPRLHPVRFVTPAAIAIVEGLDSLIDAHRDEPVEIDEFGFGTRRVPLAEATWGFPSPVARRSRPNDQPIEPRLPLVEVWLDWWRGRPPDLRDEDGLELLRALTIDWRQPEVPFGRDRTPTTFPEGLTVPQPRFGPLVQRLLEWICALEPASAVPPSAVLDHLEVAAAALEPAAADLTDEATWQAAVGRGAKEAPNPERFIDLAATHRASHRAAWTTELERRLWGLLRFLDEPPIVADPASPAAVDPSVMGGTDAGPASESPAAMRAELAKLASIGIETDDDAVAEAMDALAGLGFDMDQLLAMGVPEAGLEGFGDPAIGPLFGLPSGMAWDSAHRRSTPDDEAADADAPASHPTATTTRRRRRRYVPLEHLLAAARAGVTTDGDVIDALIGPRNPRWHTAFEMLSRVSTRTPRPLVELDDRLNRIVDRVRRRILDVELARGEAPSAASQAALSLGYAGGVDACVRLVRALGKDPFVRGFQYGGESRSVVFSQLIRATFPTPEDTPQGFADAARAARIPERRLIELALFAPQWARGVEAAVGWEGLADGAWWLHAHTKDEHWSVDHEITESWTAEIAQRTPLPALDLLHGAVDVSWFQRAYGSVGPERWTSLDAAAKYGSSAGGHKRATLFADAMRGAVSEGQLLARIGEKRHQDSVRALGLVALPIDASRDATLLDRYQRLQEFIRTSRQFGSARQASEKRAAEVGLENLARTAGFADPIRLGWAMEARGIADLADGPVSVVSGDVEVALAISESGEAEVTFRRGGSELKSIPPAVRKDASVAALRSRAADLRKRAGRVRRSFETAMTRGDAFTGAEIRELLAHPLVRPVLERLVLVVGTETTSAPAKTPAAIGWPVAGGLAVRDAAGVDHPVGSSDVVRIAHALDLAGRDWPAWQADVFRRELVQPFKQVFRELYVPVGDERTEAVSHRYAGHQLQPRQTLAILGSRGWVNSEAGPSRTFHDERISAWIGFEIPFLTPADVEHAALDTVSFTRADEWRPMSIRDVPPRIFSEVMRDLDLVVSVAHAGGVDPEATASTVEMRASILTETLKLVGLDNVRLDGNRAIVRGSFAEYSVHLGSALAQVRPGGALVIVPVHGQHRGRLFLPFADDDPRTAEVISKVLLLARDQDIRDPNILEQIRAIAR